MKIDKLKPLSGAAHDTLVCLFFHGPVEDGDVPSKSGRDDLHEAELIDRCDGWQWLTRNGITLALGLGLDRQKEQWQRNQKKRRTSAEALRGIADDFMMSDAHHPGYVLIPTTKFEQLRAAAERLA